MNPRECGLGRFLYGEKGRAAAAGDPGLAELIEQIKGPHAKLHESASKIQASWKVSHPGLSLELAHRMDDHRKWVAELSNSLLAGREITVQDDPDKCPFGIWMAGPAARELMENWPEFRALLRLVDQYHKRLHKSAALIKAANTDQERKQIFEDQTLPALNTLSSDFAKMQALESQLEQAQDKARDLFQQETLPALQATQAKLADLNNYLSGVGDRAKASMQSEVVRSENITTIAGLIGVLIGILAAIFITRSITKPVNRVVRDLSEGSSQVAGASSQVAGASQNLASGASRQAAALEQIAASLEEMDSMAKQNADSARQADDMMRDAEQVVINANQAMEELKRSMQAIDDASGETAKIVKTIDEISFQTNLLALNAAVEAARAGEAGAGFAVVADEVRNLALRAAEAAKSTQQLIELNISNIKESSQVVARTDESFREVETSSHKVAELLDGIATASTEQTQGISQISLAAAEMEKVTQEVAAGAEESAAASEELSAQSLTMEGQVDDLLAIIRGSQANGRQKTPKTLKNKDIDPVSTGLLKLPSPRVMRIR
jgi:methyl-accepting chemotaxis protein